MGIISDIFYMPGRVLKVPFKFMALPLKIGWHIIFGSKKEQADKQMELEKQAIKDEFEKKKEALQAPVPFYVDGDPKHKVALCKAIDQETASDEIQAICKMAKGGGTRRLRRGRGRGRGRGRRQTKVRYQ
jgi:hypothetical protein